MAVVRYPQVSPNSYTQSQVSVRTHPQQASLSTTPAPTTCECNSLYNLQCEQGATLSSQIIITLDDQSIDVTGSTFEFTAKVDPSYTDDDPTTVIIDWQEINTPTLGQTWLVIPAATTQTMQLIGYVYQIRMVSSSGVVTPIVKGVLTIVQPVSSRF
jgi:hypothetical protein